MVSAPALVCWLSGLILSLAAGPRLSQISTRVELPQWNDGNAPVRNQNLWDIQKATADDAAPLAKFAERSFRDAFGAMNDPADVDAYCARAFTPAIGK